MWADRWNKGGDVINPQQQEVGRQVTDVEDGDEEQQGGWQQQEDTRQVADDDDETRQGGEPQQENRQEVGKGGVKQSLEESIRIVKFRMQQEERQERTNGEREARRESETHREKRESEQEIKWEIGKGKGMRRRKATRGEERRVGGTVRQEGKGRGEAVIQRAWEDWWRVREAGWMNEEWGELSGDDLDMGENGMELRREQWEEIRNSKMRSEAICKAEKLGEEMESEIKGTWKGTDRSKERWGSSAEENDRSGFESLQEKVGRLASRRTGE